MKFLKRVIGGVLSAFMLVGSVAPALAASDIVTTTSSGYQYLSGVSSKLGYRSQTKATVSSGNYKGLPAYCLEFHKDMTTGVALTETTSFWNTLQSAGLSDAQISGIAYTSNFGYPNFNYGITDENALYVATQWIMWEYALAYRTSADGDNPTAGLNGSFLSEYADLEKTHQSRLREYLGDSSFDIRQRFWYAMNDKGYSNVITAYRGILNNIKNATTKPSFLGSSTTLKWSDTNQRYEATLTDTNKVINSGYYWSASCSNSNVNFSYSGNTMTIYTTADLSNVQITMTKNLPTDELTSVILINSSNSSAQKMLVGTYPINAQTGTLTISTEVRKGTIQLTKVNADDTSEKLSGAAFTVYTDTNKNGTFDSGTDTQYGTMTESSGVYTLKDVPVGMYLVKETKAPANYEIDPKYYSVTVTADTTSTVANLDSKYFADTPTPVDVPFLKVDETGTPLAGAKLVVYDSSNKQVEAWTSGTSAHVISTLTIGKTYRLHETAAPDGYFTADDITFTVTANSSGNVVTISGKAASSVTMADEPLIVMPETGGMGTRLFPITGVSLMGAAAMLFLYRKKIHRK